MINHHYVGVFDFGANGKQELREAIAKFFSGDKKNETGNEGAISISKYRRFCSEELQRKCS